MAVTARPEISKILLDLGIEPVDVYAVDNAEKTYMSALIEGINTLEIANQGDSPRSRILRDELKGLREKRRKINVNKLFARKQVIPTNKIKPQALLPGSADDEKKGGMDGKINSILDSIIGILRIGNKQNRKEADIDKKEREKSSRKVRENLLESTKGIAKVGKNLVGKIVSPFANILDAIGRFFKFVLAGYLFNVLFKWFTDPENKKKIDTLTRFFSDWWPALAFAAAAFLTPLGTILGALIGFLAWSLPALVGLIARNPWLAGVALFTAPAWLTKVFPNLGKTPTQMNIEKSISEKGVEATRQLLSEEYTDKLIKFQQSNNPFEKAKLNDELLELQNQINKLGGRVNNQRQDDSDETGEGVVTMNKGGFVSPSVFGESNRDTVPAMLTPGEFVITKDAVKRYGTNIFEGINASAKVNNTMKFNKRMNSSASVNNTMKFNKRMNSSASVNNIMKFNKGGLIKNTVQKFEGGGLVGNLKDMVKNINDPSKSISTYGGESGFFPAKAVGLVAIEVPVSHTSDKTIVLPEKRISKQDQTPTKIGSKTIPDIMIVNRSTYREMTTRSLGIHDLVGV